MTTYLEGPVLLVGLVHRPWSIGYLSFLDAGRDANGVGDYNGIGVLAGRFELFQPESTIT